MGSQMMSHEPKFVSFEKKGDTYSAFVAIDGFLSGNDDLPALLAQASALYGRYVLEMRTLVDLIAAYRRKRHPLPARKVWQLGDLIFRLVGQLNRLSLEIDGIYDHLERDLGTKRKWLEKVIIFRRYIAQETTIPEHLNWGRCEKGTRRIAEMIQRGTFPGERDERGRR